MLPEQIIKRPLTLTEKGTRLQEDENQYMFEVHPKANKIQIRDAIETLFSVKVTKVRTLIMRGRVRRMGRGHAKNQNWKKAFVSVADGETIDFWEGA
ncbi:MAG: 50S ribosomal protein L23 [Myxococcales bacterium]|nr:50S ribosomal protein L23 [Myxococcales bacterium]